MTDVPLRDLVLGGQRFMLRNTVTGETLEYKITKTRWFWQVLCRSHLGNWWGLGIIDLTSQNFIQPIGSDFSVMAIEAVAWRLFWKSVQITGVAPTLFEFKIPEAV